MDVAGNSTGPVADTSNITIESIVPVVTDNNISVSGSSGTAGSFIAGDTLTLTWDNTASGDNNSDIASATVDLSAFGGSLTEVLVNNAGSWTATYNITSGSTNGSALNATVTAIDAAGNSTGPVADTSDITIVSTSPNSPTAPNAPTINLANDSGISDDNITNALPLSFSGTGEVGATVTLSNSSNAVGTAVVAADSSWSLTLDADVDSVTFSNLSNSLLNTTYSLVSDTTSLTFGADYNPSGSPSVIDNTKPVYSASIVQNGVIQTWYVWARESSGYHLSQLDNTNEWYWEWANSVLAATPQAIQGLSNGWAQSTVSAAQVQQDIGTTDESNIIINFESGSALVDGDHTYTVSQADLTGNTSPDTSLTVTIDSSAPVVTDNNISVSGSSGSSGGSIINPNLIANWEFIINDILTFTWDNTTSGDNNPDIASATIDLSAFGGNPTQTLINSADSWSATYTIDSNSVSDSDLNATVTVVDTVGNSIGPIADTTDISIDSSVI